MNLRKDHYRFARVSLARGRPSDAVAPRVYAEGRSAVVGSVRARLSGAPPSALFPGRPEARRPVPALRPGGGPAPILIVWAPSSPGGPPLQPPGRTASRAGVASAPSGRRSGRVGPRGRPRGMHAGGLNARRPRDKRPATRNTDPSAEGPGRPSARPRVPNSPPSLGGAAGGSMSPGPRPRPGRERPGGTFLSLDPRRLRTVA